jgi:cation:H+ antiporter
MSILLLLIGAALLVAGAELLVSGAARLAAAAAVPPLVIGLTVVALGTSAPELAVSAGAVLSGSPAIAVGNVIGSNIFNVLFILGVSAVVMPLVVQRQIVRIDVPIMIAASLLMMLLAADSRIGRLDGALLVSALIGYTFFQIRGGRRETAASALVAAASRGAGNSPAALPGAVAAGASMGAAMLVRSVLAAAGGLVLLVLGSRLFVGAAVALAQQIGVSDVVIGLTIIAAGTSLPEVATSVLASVRGQRDIAVGNVIGSNIFNILGILGICGLVGPVGVAVAPAFVAFDLPVMIAVALAALPILVTGLRVSRGEGLLLLGYYVAYTLYIVLKATEHDALDAFGGAMLLFVLPLTAISLLVMLALGVRRTARA